MLKICIKYANILTVLSNMQKICPKYARFMLKYAYYMPFYAINMQLYAPNMRKICKYIDCISQICKRYARNMPEICLNMLKNADIC